MGNMDTPEKAKSLKPEVYKWLQQRKQLLSQIVGINDEL